MLQCCEDAVRKACGLSGAALVKSLKGMTARRLRSRFTRRVNCYIVHGHLWSPSYSAASCDRAQLSIIRQHIEQQRPPVKAPSWLARP
jgi:putative transposase